jgi:2-dehydropantoate 2-reductase
VTFLRPGVVRHAGRGATHVGVARGPPSLGRQVAALFTASGLPCTHAADLGALLWRKAVVNAAINPITACLRLPNGEVLRRPESRLLSRVAAAEAAAVAAAEGVEVGDAWGAVRSVLEATASNRSSMLQDIEAGRRTEVDSITGEVVRAARRRGVAVPANAGLLRVVRALRAP